MDMLGTGMSWLNRQLKANVATTITYRRGAYSVEIQATLGSSLLRVQDGQGQTKVERVDRDFLFDAADLVLNGAQVPPDDGDRIELDGKSYEVMPIGSDPSWRYADAHSTRVRVHSKYRGEV
jgi:surface antigen